MCAVLVKQFATTTRSRVHSVTVTNGLPKLVIACYAQGQIQRSLLSVWRTVTVLHPLYYDLWNQCCCIYSV